MYTFKKGDADYQVMLNENFSEITDALENGALVSKKTVIKAQDWDEILDKGIYTVFGASGANRPYSGAVYGVLVVYADNTFICQNYMYKGETYIRSRQGSPATWTTWNKLLGNNEQPFEAHFGTGADGRDVSAGYTYPLGPLLATDFWHNSKTVPLTVNANNTSITFNKDTMVNISATFKIHGAVSTDYVYCQLLQNNTVYQLVQLGVPTGTAINLSNMFEGSLVLKIAAGDTIKFEAAMREGKQIFRTAIISLSIREVKSI